MPSLLKRWADEAWPSPPPEQGNGGAAKPRPVMVVDAELSAGPATAQIVRLRFDEPIDNLYRDDERYRLDLSLAPRQNARVGFPDSWGPHRFETLRRTVLIPSGQSMHAKNGCGSWTSIVCLLTKDAMAEAFDGDLAWGARRLEACVDISNAHINWLLSRLSDEMLHPGFASTTLVELIAAQLMIELRRYCTPFCEGPASGGLTPWRLRLIDERLAEVPEAPMLDELARACGLSVRQLTRGYRASRGCSIGEAIALSRIEHAKRMLRAETRVKAIARRMGFSSSSSFAYAFRRATGYTPRQYRASGLDI